MGSGCRHARKEGPLSSPRPDDAPSPLSTTLAAKAARRRSASGLALRLVLAFGLLAALSTAGLGLLLRESRIIEETTRFQREVRSACTRVADEVKRQAESDRRLIASSCAKGDLVDRVLVSIEAGQLDERRLALATGVPTLREAFGLDGLVLVTGGGEVLGADPKPLLNIPADEVRLLVAGAPGNFLRGTRTMTGLVARCRKDEGRRTVALVGVRDATALLGRLGATAGVDIVPHQGAIYLSSRQEERARCAITDPSGASLELSVTKSKSALVETLERTDRTVLYASLASAGAALLLGILLARSLSRPLSALAEQAGKVAEGDAKPLELRGSREVRDVADAFNRMLRDLEGTRRRLAAASRIAAWREVARRVAHEVKNPLAPIRAAVETLRRLRARNDPRFDEYFDEATRTVLDEVHRISNIVTEFTKFARLPAPKVREENLLELCERVVGLQRAVAGETRIEIRAEAGLPRVVCDADQIVQVLTNLVQNAVEAVRGLRTPKVFVDVELEGDTRVAISVRDTGPGVAVELTPRLFEPYATTKVQGTGLGLAIAQRIAVEHGGELAYVGEPGSGATFRLILPVRGPESPRHDGGDAPSEAPLS